MRLNRRAPITRPMSGLRHDVRLDVCVFRPAPTGFARDPGDSCAHERTLPRFAVKRHLPELLRAAQELLSSIPNCITTCQVASVRACPVLPPALPSLHSVSVPSPFGPRVSAAVVAGLVHARAATLRFAGVGAAHPAARAWAAEASRAVSPRPEWPTDRRAQAGWRSLAALQFYRARW